MRAVAIHPRLMLATASLRPYDRNSRTHSPAQVEQLVASIREWGWTNPILVDEARLVLAGHARLEAAGKLGLAEVPCIQVGGLSVDQKRALVLADNKLALNAGWDEDLLRLELGSLQEAGFDLGLTGFSLDEIEELLAEKGGGLTDPDEAPPLDPVAVSRLGDRWALGRHRLMCGSATVQADVAGLLGGVRPHLMVTDPPYGVEYNPGWRNETGKDENGITRHVSSGLVVRQGATRAIGKVLNDDRADWREAWALFPGSVAYVWHAGLFADVVVNSLRSCRLNIRAQIVWVKTRHVLSRGDYHPQHEPCVYAVRDGGAEEWQGFEADHEIAAYAVRDGSPGQYRGGRKQSTVWMIEHLRSETGHGTQKPVEAMRRPILNNSRAGQAVYEPFSGSGTTLVACEMEGRVCLAMELSPNYVDVAVRRWQSFTGQVALLQGSGRSFAEVEAERAGVAGP